MKKIINDIDKYFRVELEKIKQLPNNLKNGVYTAHVYCSKHTTKIEYSSVELLNERIQMSNKVKTLGLVSGYMTSRFVLA